MKSTLGQPRALTDAQVQTVLEWDKRKDEWRRRRAGHPTFKALVKELGVGEYVVQAAIRRGREYVAPPVWDRPVGRPPRLPALGILKRIHDWNEEHLALRKLREEIGTQASLARQLGVSTSVVQAAIRCGGQYKQASRENRQHEVLRRRAVLQSLRARGF
jgi:hypothetical protein